MGNSGNKEARVPLQPDEEATECRKCKKPFTWSRRRHHCRVCGKIFCDDCSAYISFIAPGYEGSAARSCNFCTLAHHNEAALQQHRQERDQREIARAHNRKKFDVPQHVLSPASPSNMEGGASQERVKEFIQTAVNRLAAKDNKLRFLLLQTGATWEETFATYRLENMDKLAMNSANHCKIRGDKYNLGEEVSEMPCGHKFHTACLKGALADDLACPECGENDLELEQDHFWDIPDDMKVGLLATIQQQVDAQDSREERKKQLLDAQKEILEALQPHPHETPAAVDEAPTEAEPQAAPADE